VPVSAWQSVGGVLQGPQLFVPPVPVPPVPPVPPPPEPAAP
jgi:hypothetical protein